MEDGIENSMTISNFNKNNSINKQNNSTNYYINITNQFDTHSLKNIDILKFLNTNDSQYIKQKIIKQSSK